MEKSFKNLDLKKKKGWNIVKTIAAYDLFKNNFKVFEKS